ncbi:MAG: hypothetical protein ACOX2R_04165 [Anaerolineae bacterium]|jgi:hypothetical protein
MVDTPRKGLGLAVSAGLMAVLLLLMAAVFYAAQRQPFGGQRVVLHTIALALLAGIVWIGLRAVRLAALRYEIADGQLAVQMGLVRWEVPLTTRVGVRQPDSDPGRLWSWPGWIHGVATDNENAATLLASTMPRRQSLLLEGSGWSLLISPRNPTAFVQQLDRAIAADEPSGELATMPLGAAAWPVWRDPSILYPLAISLLGTLLLYAGAALAHPLLPRQITQVGSEAASRVLVPQDAAQALPTVAALGTLGNCVLSVLLHRHSRVLAHLWVYGALAQQAVLWVGLWRLLRG